MAKPVFLDGPAPVAMAHRGGGDPARENTWHAFNEAVDLGYRYIETDSWVTSDGEVVLFHDADLSRVSDVQGPILSMDYKTVAAARIAGTETVPRLKDVLGTWGDMRLNIDLKCDEVVEPFVEVIKSTGAYDRVCVASFSQKRIDQAATLLGRPVCRSAGRSMITQLRLLSAATGSRVLAKSIRNRPDVVQVPVKHGRIPIATPAFIERMHAWGIDIHCWTINDAAEMDALLDQGVDGLISDETQVLKQVLQRRGQWRASS